MKLCLDRIVLFIYMVCISIYDELLVYGWIIGIWMNWGLWPYGQVMDESPCGDRIVGNWVMVIMALEDGTLT